MLWTKMFENCIIWSFGKTVFDGWIRAFGYECLWQQYSQSWVSWEILQMDYCPKFLISYINMFHLILKYLNFRLLKIEIFWFIYFFISYRLHVMWLLHTMRRVLLQPWLPFLYSHNAPWHFILIYMYTECKQWAYIHVLPNSVIHATYLITIPSIYQNIF